MDFPRDVIYYDFVRSYHEIPNNQTFWRVWNSEDSRRIIIDAEGIDTRKFAFFIYFFVYKCLFEALNLGYSHNNNNDMDLK